MALKIKLQKALALCPGRQGKQPSDREKEATKAGSSALPKNEVGTESTVRWEPADKSRSQGTREVSLSLM